MRLVLVMFLVACGSVRSQTPADAPPGPGDAGSAGPDAAIDAAVMPHKLVFVTSQAFTGNLGGVAGADTKCQTLAQAASRPGTFKAWLGNASVSAFTRMARATVPYTLVDGTVVANDFTGLTSGTLLHGIDITELGTKALGGTATDCFSGGSGLLVWTNANSDGSIVNNNPVNSCGADWNSSGPSTSTGPFGVVGVIGKTNGNWTVLCGSGKCETTAPLYCFEQ
jgi:hypothetical protein